MAQTRCPYCDRPLAGEICPAHGYVGKKTDEVPGTVPMGGIIMYDGLVSAIPKCFALCDGTKGTPDLRGLFILGAGGVYNVGATGGSSAAHSHTVSVNAHAQATSSELAALTHGGSVADHAADGTGYAGSSLDFTTGLGGPTSHSLSGNVGVSDHSTHTHTVPDTGGPSANSTFNVGAGVEASRPTTTHTHTVAATGADGPTTHTVTQPAVSAHSTHDHTVEGASDHLHSTPSLSHTYTASASHAAHSHTVGVDAHSASSGTAGSMPAYYALAYIKRIS
jgi:hypothetical protein